MQIFVGLAMDLGRGAFDKDTLMSKECIGPLGALQRGMGQAAILKGRFDLGEGGYGSERGAYVRRRSETINSST